MRISDSQIDQIHRMFDAIEPARQRPLYVVRAEGLADELRAASSDCLGFAIGGTRTFALAEAIGDQWQGPGDAVVLDGALIAAESLPGEFERAVLNTAVHEIAHVIPSLPPLPLPNAYAPTDGAKEFAARRIRDEMRARDTLPGADDDSHDWRFYRRCLHAWFRAITAGFDVPLRGLFGVRLGATDAAHYLPLLMAEVDKMRNEDFATIEQTPPPRRFMALWECDVAEMRGFAQ